MNKPAPAAHLLQTGTDDVAVEAVIALLEELTSIIVGENRLLAQGLPASLSQFVTRKTELSEVFERWVADVKAHKIHLSLASPDRREYLIQCTRQLGVNMEENLSRLRLAMEASRRRIDAIMAAIREQTVRPGYSANGRAHGGATTGSVLGAQMKV
jgi:hypothetical protein